MARKTHSPWRFYHDNLLLCFRVFNRRYNMIRHKHTLHADTVENTEEGELSDYAKE